MGGGRVAYDEFGLFHENAAEFGLPYDGPPVVRRERVELDDGRALSALVWGDADPELVLLPRTEHWLLVSYESRF